MRPGRSDGQARQAMIVMPQWNADAISHNAFVRDVQQVRRVGAAAVEAVPRHPPAGGAGARGLRGEREYRPHDRGVPAGRGGCAQLHGLAGGAGVRAVWRAGHEPGQCYAFIAAAMDPRIRVCAFNHASTQFGDVVWTGQSTRHVQAAFEHAGLTQDEVRAMFAGVSPMATCSRSLRGRAEGQAGARW